jgi:hypothetical protein
MIVKRFLRHGNTEAKPVTVKQAARAIALSDAYNSGDLMREPTAEDVAAIAASLEAGVAQVAGRYRYVPEKGGAE